MPVDTIRPPAALVVIDLQRGITALPTIGSADDVVARSARLADAFRERGLPVVLVNTAFSSGGADALRPATDAQAPVRKMDADFAVLRPELGDDPADVRITKRQWDAFHGTELDLQLRRRGVRSIVLTGISTSIGVESTARQGYFLGYELVIPSDAVTDTNPASHDDALERIFPRLGRIDTTDAILAALPDR